MAALALAHLHLECQSTNCPTRRPPPRVMNNALQATPCTATNKDTDASIHHNVAEEFTEQDFGDNEFQVTDSEGFDLLAQELYRRTNMDDQRLWLDSIVTHVEWHGDGAGPNASSVTLAVSRKSEASTRQVEAVSVRKVHCRCALLTVSLGVLQVGRTVSGTFGLYDCFQHWWSILDY